jgi:tRNA-dihydrouridine synthase
VKIPVIGNGDVVDIDSAVRMYETTGCDGIMIGRGARGNPWIFEELTHFIKTGQRCSRPDKEEIKKTILQHAELQRKYKGEYTAIREMRKHVAWYTGGLPNSAALRRRVNEIETMEEMEKLISAL